MMKIGNGSIHTKHIEQVKRLGDQHKTDFDVVICSNLNGSPNFTKLISCRDKSLAKTCKN